MTRNRNLAVYWRVRGTIGLLFCGALLIVYTIYKGIKEFQDQLAIILGILFLLLGLYLSRKIKLKK